MSDIALSSAAAVPHDPDAVPVRRVIAFVIMVFGMFMAILDIQVVSSSLSEIQAGLGAGSDEISWVQTAYLIAEVIMIPLSGTLARILSTRVLFAVSAAGFTIASLLCATASSIDQMIFYRAIQGFIGGGMIPSVFTAAYSVFPPSKRGIVSPIIGLVATLAPTIGPTVGGYLTSIFSWHWLFLVNVPAGIVVALGSWALIDFDKPEFELMKKFDWWGLLGLAGFLGAMEYVLEEGPSNDWLSDDAVLMCTIVMVLGGVLFFWRAFKADFPIVDLRAFGNVNFSIGSVFSFAMGIGIYGLTYIYPLYLGRVLGYNSMQIGETMFVSGLAMFMTAPVAGALSQRFDPRALMMIGFLLFAASTWIPGNITADWGFNELLVPQIFRGVGMMLCMVPINNLALGTLAPSRLKGGSGLFNLTRNLGGAVGLAVINTVMTNRDTLHNARLADSMSWSNPEAMNEYNLLSQTFGANGLDGSTAAIKQMAMQAQGQAYVMTIADTFLLMTVLFVVLAACTIFMQKPKAVPAEAAGH